MNSNLYAHLVPPKRNNFFTSKIFFLVSHALLICNLTLVKFAKFEFSVVKVKLCAKLDPHW